VNLRSALPAVFAALLIFGMGACSRFRDTPEYQSVGNLVSKVPGVGTSDLQYHAVRSSKTVIVRKIAIMPLLAEPDRINGELEQGAAEAVTAELYARATLLGGWTVVPQEDVEQALQQMPPTNASNLDQNALELGRKLAVDGVVYGAVHRYRERVGYDFAAQTPAAISFALNFVDEKSKQVIWNASFSREQKALSQNVLDLPNFIHNTGRWVRAEDLAEQGAQEALANLQSKVTIQSVVQGQY
jgi:hypothetical protein